MKAKGIRVPRLMDTERYQEAYFNWKEMRSKGDTKLTLEEYLIYFMSEEKCFDLYKEDMDKIRDSWF